MDTSNPLPDIEQIIKDIKIISNYDDLLKNAEMFFYGELKESDRIKSILSSKATMSDRFKSQPSKLLCFYKPVLQKSCVNMPL